MYTANGLDTLVALKIFIKVLELYGADKPPKKNRRKPRPAKGGVGLSGGSR